MLDLQLGHLRINISRFDIRYSAAYKTILETPIWSAPNGTILLFLIFVLQKIAKWSRCLCACVCLNTLESVNSIRYNGARREWIDIATKLKHKRRYAFWAVNSTQNHRARRREKRNIQWMRWRNKKNFYRKTHARTRSQGRCDLTDKAIWLKMNIAYVAPTGCLVCCLSPRSHSITFIDTLFANATHHW